MKDGFDSLSPRRSRYPKLDKNIKKKEVHSWTKIGKYNWAQLKTSCIWGVLKYTGESLTLKKKKRNVPYN